MIIFDWASNMLYFGNFRFIAEQEEVSEDELISRQGIERFQIMGRETVDRGEQAGGGLVLASDSSGLVRFVGHKVVNKKRKNLTYPWNLDSYESVNRRYGQAIDSWELVPPRPGTNDPVPADRRRFLKPTGMNGAQLASIGYGSRSMAAGRCGEITLTIGYPTMEPSIVPRQLEI
ncbi:MAG: hypothetical protein WCP63_01340 [Cyanobium sp. ELA712]